jgi:hypothetical protein
MPSKRNPPSLPDPAELQLTNLADDPEFHHAQTEFAAAEQSLLEAEKRHTAAQLPAEERAAFRQVDQLRSVLGLAGDRLAEVASRKSLEVCKRFRPGQEHYLRELLNALEAAAEVFACLAGLHARIAVAGYGVRSDVLGLSLPPAVYQLGSAGDFSSQLASFRRWLQAEGVFE